MTHVSSGQESKVSNERALASTAWVQILAPPLMGCVTLDQLLDLSLPEFSYF